MTVSYEEMARRIAAQSTPTLDHAEMARRVALRFEIRKAASSACSRLPKGRTASSRAPVERMLIAMGEGALLPENGPTGKLAFANILRKFKQVVDSVRHAPKLWDHFKTLIGVESLDELPGKLKEMASTGFHALQKAFHSAFEKWPLKLYTIPEGKLLSVNKLLEKLLKLAPGFERWLHTNVKPKVDQFDHWLKEKLPHFSKIVMVSIYIWIWLNVVEFEWNLKDLLAAAAGSLSLSDLLASLPASIIGFLMNSFGFGTFTLLPVALAARILVLLAARYIEYDGGFRINYEKISADFKIPKDSIV